MFNNFKTSKIIRFINQNLIGIIVAIIAVIIIISVLQVLNNDAKEKRENERNNVKVNISKDPSTETVIYGKDVTDEEKETNNQVMNDFLELCNNGDAEGAYNLISDNCKEQLYPTLNDFINLYYSQTFNSKKTYDIQSWIKLSDRYTYKVRILEDMLSTGNYDANSVIEDYVTVVNENDVAKLNISSYIGEEEINKSTEVDNIKILVSKKYIYINYETYQIEVENNSEFNIMLDSKLTLGSTYLLSDGNIKYSSYIDETIDEDLKVKSGESKSIYIDFNKMYNPDIAIDKVVFADMAQSYVSYDQIRSGNNFKGRLYAEIEI